MNVSGLGGRVVFKADPLLYGPMTIVGVLPPGPGKQRRLRCETGDGAQEVFDVEELTPGDRVSLGELS